ncbi:MAG: polysaccharide deacetylase family protein, partial [bacterium]|nr:polysaccharide deacetylase family protein [bacterium]
ETLYKYMKEGLELPEKSIVITFDDGRLDSLYNGNPTLKALDYQAIMFIITAYSLSEEGSSYYINGDQLIQMEKNGTWDVQAHTEKGHDSPVTGPDGLTGHFFSHKLWLEEEGRPETEDEFRERVSDDLDKAKSRLSVLLNKEIVAFAFPFGDFGQHATNFSGAKDIMLELMEEKYRLGFFQDAPGFRFSENYPATDSGNNLAMIRRIDINPSWSGDELLDRLKQSQAKSLPYEDDFSKNNGWIAAWGNIDIAPSQMSISPKSLTAESDAQTGGATILDGTRAWKNYEINMTLEVPNLNSAFIWARFRDDDNNASCNFGNGFAHAEQIINGEQRVLRGIRGPEITIPRGEFEARVKVEGRHISCFINNRLVVESYFMDENLDSGGIGFKTWDPEIGRSILLVKKITANEL